MSAKNKKLFLILSVVIPFVIYSIVYYMPMVRNAPFQEKEFVSLEYKWGLGNQFENSYNSATGIFSYKNRLDSSVIRNIKLSVADIKYLDSIADVQGFWNLPSVVANGEADLTNPKLLRYNIKFNYKRKSKEVTYFPNFNGNEKMKMAAGAMQKEIEQFLIDRENQGHE